MADEIVNAITLIKSSDFRDWCRVLSAFQARKVIVESDTTPDHAVRLKLAERVILDPDFILNRVVNILATDPAVCGLGTRIGQDITQDLLVAKAAEIWTPLAKLVSGASS